MSVQTLVSNKEQNKYKITGVQPGDGQAIPALFRKIYGEHYLSAAVYDPANYRPGLDDGRLPLVARGGDGRAVGHLAMLPSAPYAGVREIGQAVVDPDCRGGGILNGLIDASVEIADADPGCCGLFGASLTNHTYSQRSVWRAEFVDLGFEIGFVPARMMQIEANARGPVATCIQYRAFGDTPARQTFLPRNYRDLLVHLFDHLGLSRDFSSPDAPLDLVPESQLEVTDLPRFDLVRVTISAIGADLPSRIAGIERQARRDGRTMVQAVLTLGSAAADAGCEALRRAGFWYGALLPRWLDDDALLLQKALDEPWFEDIQAYTNDAQALLRFIRADAERQSALAEMGLATVAA